MVAGIMLAGMLLVTVASYFFFVQHSVHEAQKPAEQRVQADTRQLLEELEVTGDLSGTSLMVQVNNNGSIPVQVGYLFVLNATTGDVLKTRSLTAVPEALNSGTAKSLNTTYTYSSGTVLIVIMTMRGTTVTGAYPLPPSGFGESQLGGGVGWLVFNFDTFQRCKPDGNDCRVTGNGWQPGWKIEASTDYLYRVKMRNVGERTLFLSKQTGFIILYAMDAVSAGDFTDNWYIKGDPVTDNTGTAYTDYSRKIPVDGQYYTIYIGADLPGTDTIEDIDNPGIFGLLLAVFAYQDVNNNGVYEAAIDTTPYAQLLPFQAVCSQNAGNPC